MGLGVDYGIHLYHRYLESGRGSIKKVWTDTGSAVLMTSLTNSVGFVSLMFTSHLGFISLGKLATIGIGSFTLVALFITGT